MIAGLVLQSFQRKVPNEYAIAEIMNDVLGSDFTEFLVRSDSEQAILVLKESLKVNVKTVEGALYASRSNGVAESAVKDVKDAVKTSLAWLFRRFGRPFLPVDSSASKGMASRLGVGRVTCIHKSCGCKRQWCHES